MYGPAAPASFTGVGFTVPESVPPYRTTPLTVPSSASSRWPVATVRFLPTVRKSVPLTGGTREPTPATPTL